jgi:hypothetical protein
VPKCLSCIKEKRKIKREGEESWKRKRNKKYIKSKKKKE